MARTNYSYEKRLRELEKQKKKLEKRQKKQDKKEDDEDIEGTSPESLEAEDEKTTPEG
jgi:hypothetical protein